MLLNNYSTATKSTPTNRVVVCVLCNYTLNLLYHLPLVWVEPALERRSNQKLTKGLAFSINQAVLQDQWCRFKRPSLCSVLCLGLRN